MRGFHCVILILLSVFLIPSVFGEELYADVSFEVSEGGDVTISSLTNSPAFADGVTQDLTSKDGKVWSLNISDSQIYIDIYYEISLPANAEINFLKSSVSSRIYVANGIPKVKGFGTNDTFDIFVQYELVSHDDFSLSNGFVVFGFIVLIVMFMFFLYFFNFKGFKRSDRRATKSNHIDSLSQNVMNLEQRQQDILRVITQRGKMTQKQLADELSLPKSSVFRNIRSLEQKGLIRKERMGMSTIISLVKKEDESSNF